MIKSILNFQINFILNVRFSFWFNCSEGVLKPKSEKIRNENLKLNKIEKKTRREEKRKEKFNE